MKIPAKKSCREYRRTVPSAETALRYALKGLRRIAGEKIDAEELAVKFLRDAEYLWSSGGGFIFSGGEPTAQGDFLMELLLLLMGNHRALETSAFCSGELFLGC
jgi:pyruvate formate lyase activating enzyme